MIIEKENRMSSHCLSQSEDFMISNAQIITANKVLEKGEIVVRDGIIEEINPSLKPEGLNIIDLNGKILMPGMIDLHGDAIEKALEPRPNVVFPIDFSLSSMDRLLLSHGVTTVFHALSFAGEELGVRNVDFAVQVVNKIEQFKEELAVRTLTHCRYEISHFESASILMDLINQGKVQLLSIMDHTPGRGQFRTDQDYIQYLVRAYKKTPEEAKDLIIRKTRDLEKVNDELGLLLKCAQKNGVVIASHDDDDIEKIVENSKLGMGISEFPLNLNAAVEARLQNMATVFGSPNVVRGKSQSNGVSAIDAVRAGVADCLCSDYMHSTLLPAVFKLYQQNILSLPDAIRLVTLNPALALGNSEIGEIAVGKRADLIAVSMDESIPVVKKVWIEGRLQYQFGYC
jgi:alpha-D-ribose 1-methylphosphonate 5-triphosphate diphosphatase